MGQNKLKCIKNTLWEQSGVLVSFTFSIGFFLKEGFINKIFGKNFILLG